MSSLLTVHLKVGNVAKTGNSVYTSYMVKIDNLLAQASKVSTGKMLSLVCHLKFPNHGPKFWDLLERVMPDWRKRKTNLERLTA